MRFEPVRGLLVFLLGLYQRFGSPIMSRHVQCRFHPTCSEYAIQCLGKYDVVTGLRKTVSRLARCRPDNLDSCIDPP